MLKLFSLSSGTFVLIMDGDVVSGNRNAVERYLVENNWSDNEIADLFDRV